MRVSRTAFLVCGALLCSAWATADESKSTKVTDAAKATPAARSVTLPSNLVITPGPNGTATITLGAKVEAKTEKDAGPKSDKTVPAANTASGTRIARPVTPKVQSIDDKATHKQTALIKVNTPNQKELQVNAFCLGHAGQILAACGDSPGEVRVLTADGEFLRKWEVDIKPEAIASAPNGTVLVAGSGSLYRFTMEGKQLHHGESPHAAAMKEGADEIRQQVITRLEQTNSPQRLQMQVKSYERFIAQLEKKDKLSDQEERVLNMFSERVQLMKDQLAKQEEKPDDGPSYTEEQVQSQMKMIMARKMRIASISSDGKHVFIATPEAEGYGYAVWKMSPDFTSGETVISGLRGCCGQMDVRACESGVFVAENSRHRVVRFDAEGEQTATWGKSDRTGVDGFTSCCNPMNVCFNKQGDVFTAESNTGRIKRFTADGDFVSYVGDVKLVPGCKNVSIAVSDDDKKVYMLDITRNHIVMMEQGEVKNAAAAGEAAEAETKAEKKERRRQRREKKQREKQNKSAGAK